MNEASLIGRALALTLTFALLGCQTLAPKPPNVAETSPEPARKTSTIAVPVRIPVQTVASLVDSKIPEGSQLYWTSGEPIGNGAVMQIGIYRQGPVSVTSSNGCLDLSFVLVINNGRVDWEHKKAFVTVKKHFDFGGAGRVAARVCPSVTDDWKLAATIQPNFSWVEGAYVNIGTPIGSFKIGVSDRVEPKIRDQLTKVAAELSATLSRIPLRANLDKAWSGIQQPVRLTKNAAPGASSSPLDVYLMAEPLMLGIGPLTTQGNEVVLTPMISTYLGVQLGKPDSMRTARPLPNNAGPIVQQGVNVALVATVPYSEVNKAAVAALHNKPIELGDKKQVTVTSVEVFPDGDRLGVKVAISARLGSLPFEDTKGTLYLRGVPRYAHQTRTLWVENLDFDLESKNVLVKSAAVLGHGIFVKAMQNALRFQLASKIDPVTQRLAEGVSGQEIAKGILLNAKATSTDISEPHVGANAITIRVHVKGDANVVGVISSP